MTQTIETRYAPGQYTPGPWTTDDSKSFYVFAGSDLICNANRQANTRLISAAPDLLAALEIVSNCVPDSDGGTTLGTWEMEQVRTAIRKATGE